MQSIVDYVKITLLQKIAHSTEKTIAGIVKKMFESNFELNITKTCQSHCLLSSLFIEIGNSFYLT